VIAASNMFSPHHLCNLRIYCRTVGNLGGGKVFDINVKIRKCSLNDWTCASALNLIAVFSLVSLLSEILDASELSDI
jgi:hypothetical protein